MNEQIELKEGDKVRTVWGEVRTVIFVHDGMVFVKEECNGWYHPSKVTKIER